MSEALNLINKRHLKLLAAQQETVEVLKEMRERETFASDLLENTVAFILDNGQSTLSAIALELNCSRDKVTAMAERARRRNMELMRKGTR